MRKLGNFDAVDRPRKLPGPWTTTRSKQYLSAVHPVTCSLLWVRCLFNRLSISDFGGMTNKNDGTPKYVSWPNLVKVGRCKVAEKSSGLPHKQRFGSMGLIPASHFAQNGLSRPKFPERCHILTCPHITNLVPINCALPDLFWKEWFFWPRSKDNNNDTNSVICDKAISTATCSRDVLNEFFIAV